MNPKPKKPQSTKGNQGASQVGDESAGSSQGLIKDPTPHIESLALAGLIPYARNSRTHSEEQVAQIAASIREFGFTNPVLIRDDLTIIAGHGRVMAARKLGLESVPCIRLSHLTETQVRAYVIADNKLALNAGWDKDLLGLELSDLREADYNLDLLGFDAAAIEAALNPPDPTPAESSSGEIDVDGMVMECKCPKCGFEFDPK